MRLVPTETHALADYLSGALLIVIPFILDWPRGLTIPLVFMGLAIIIYSAITDYEFGLWPVLGLRAHLLIDAGVGFTLLIVPLLFGVDTLWPLLAVGAILTVLPMTTELDGANALPRRAPVADRQRNSAA